ncbi:hypothetical protein [Streptomyces sp. NPDC005485]|uniref:hypothetical protein n=1 Tax=Streptomyces sp. NPDC005485 TaxID=3155591 RepID=UPI0033AB391C
MSELNLPVPLQPGQPYLLTDAAGRTYVSSAPPAPAPIALPGQVHNGLAPACSCAHALTPAAPFRRSAKSPGTMLAVGVLGFLVVGVVLVALLLSVAVVAAAVATVALSLAVCAVVARSLASDNGRAWSGRYRR